MEVYLIEHYKFYRVATIGIAMEIGLAKDAAQKWVKEQEFEQSSDIHEIEATQLLWDRYPDKGHFYSVSPYTVAYANFGGDTAYITISKWPLLVDAKYKPQAIIELGKGE